jgi:hypothetical protein
LQRPSIQSGADRLDCTVRQYFVAHPLHYP